MQIKFLGSGSGPPTDAMDVLTTPLQMGAPLQSAY